MGFELRSITFGIMALSFHNSWMFDLDIALKSAQIGLTMKR